MSTQNFKNHSRFHPLYHYVFSVVTIVSIALAVLYFLRNGAHVLSVLLLFISIGLLVIFLLLRTYSLKVQDRAIRVEENLRYFSLTGKLFDSQLTLSQIIALRFATDSELVELADKAVKQNMSSKEIKQSIQNWKVDNNRI